MKIATIGKIVSLFAIMVLAYMILTKDTELQYEVKGRVAGFSNTNTSIIIEHEKIEGYMDAMTMPFNVKDISGKAVISVNSTGCKYLPLYAGFQPRLLNSLVK
jgi:Cu/Ag efflux protein CusF